MASKTSTRARGAANSRSGGARNSRAASSTRSRQAAPRSRGKQAAAAPKAASGPGGGVGRGLGAGWKLLAKGVGGAVRPGSRSDDADAATGEVTPARPTHSRDGLALALFA